MSKQKNGDLPRGFKTQANQYSREFRQELGIKKHEPLCPWKLANFLLIPVLTLSDLEEEIPRDVQFFKYQDTKSFSAVTVFDRHRRLIVNNDAHSRCRQAANLAHELSHAILGHQPDRVFDLLGCRNFNKDYENQANWLGPTLLISEEAALYITSTKMEMSEAVKKYGASEELIRMRINITGALKRIK